MILIDTLNPFVPLTTCNGNGHIRGTLLDPNTGPSTDNVCLSGDMDQIQLNKIYKTNKTQREIKWETRWSTCPAVVEYILDQLMVSPEGFRFKVIVKWYYHRLNSALLARLFSIYWNAERVRFGKLQYLKSEKGILLATLLLQHLHNPPTLVQLLSAK